MCLCHVWGLPSRLTRAVGKMRIRVKIPDFTFEHCMVFCARYGCKRATVLHSVHVLAIFKRVLKIKRARVARGRCAGWTSRTAASAPRRCTCYAKRAYAAVHRRCDDLTPRLTHSPAAVSGCRRTLRFAAAWARVSQRSMRCARSGRRCVLPRSPRCVPPRAHVLHDPRRPSPPCVQTCAACQDHSAWPG